MATYTNQSGSKYSDVLNYDEKASSTVVYHANGGNDTINIAGSKNLKVMLDSGSNTINAKSGSDITIKVAEDIAEGNKVTGNDKLIINGANAVEAILGSGKDEVTLSNSNGSKATGGSSQIRGGDWGDTFTVNEGARNYQLYGEAGNDIFNINGGKNMNFWGGAANDTFVVKGGTNNKLYGGDSADTFEIYADGQNMILGYGNDIVNVHEGDNQTITANLGINEINLLAGSGHVIEADIDKTASAKAGKDVGYGQDTVNVNGATNVTMNLGDGRDTVNLSSGSNHTIDAGGWNDTINITGDVTDSVISGGAGDDTINVSGGSNNTIQGGAGKDTIVLDWEKVGSGNIIDQTGAGSAKNDTIKLENVDSTAFDIVKNGDTLTLTEKDGDKTLSIQGFGQGTDSITFDDRTMSGFDFVKELVIEDGAKHGEISLGGYSPEDPTDFKITLKNGTTGTLTAFKDERDNEEELESLIAKGNTVLVEKDGYVVANDDQEDEGDVVGVFLKAGHAEGNSATVENGSIEGSLMGAGVEEGTAVKNTASLTGASAEEVGGAQVLKGAANSNVAVVESGQVTALVVGGMVVTGDANENSVTINKSQVGTVLGGASGADDEEEEIELKGDANGNKVTIADSTVANSIAAGGTYNGTANNNIVDLTNVGVGGEEEDSGFVYGGKVDIQGNAEGNSVTMSGGKAVSVIGAQAKAGDVIGNQVSITGAVITGDVIGGRTESGKAENNTVNIGDNAVIEGNVIANASENGAVGEGTVKVTGGTIKGAILGSEAADTANIEGGIITKIDLGAGADMVKVTGGQTSEIADGAGDDTIDVTGGLVYKIKLGEGTNTVNVDVAPEEDKELGVKEIVGSAGENIINVGQGEINLLSGSTEAKDTYAQVNLSGKGAEVTLNNADAASITGVELEKGVDKLNLINSIATIDSGTLDGVAVNGGYNELTMNGGNSAIMVNKGSLSLVVDEGATVGWVGSDSSENTQIIVNGGNVWSGNMNAVSKDYLEIKSGFANMDLGMGDDEFVMGGGAAENIQLGDGNDTATIHSGSLKTLDTGTGSDTVTIEKWGDNCKVENVILNTGSNIVNVKWADVDNIVAGDSLDTINLGGGNVGLSGGTFETVNVKEAFNTVRVNDAKIDVLNVVAKGDSDNANKLELNNGDVVVSNGYLENVKIVGGEANALQAGDYSTQSPVQIKRVDVEEGNVDLNVFANNQIKEVKVKNEESVVNITMGGSYGEKANELDVVGGAVASVTLTGQKNVIRTKGDGAIASIVGSEKVLSTDKAEMAGGSITLDEGYLSEVNMFGWGDYNPETGEGEKFENDITVKGEVGNIVCNWWGGDTTGQIVADVKVEGGKVGNAVLGGGADKLTITGGNVSGAKMGKGDDTLTFSAGEAGEAGSAGTFDMGEGNDAVIVKEYGYIHEIDLGAGDDTFAQEITGEPWWSQVATLKTGSGNNTIDMKGGSIGTLLLGDGENEINLVSGEINNVVGSEGANTVNVVKGSATLTNGEAEGKVVFDAVNFAGQGATVTLNNADVTAVTGAAEIAQPEEGSDKEIKDTLNLINSNVTMTGGKLTGISVNGGYNEINMNAGDTTIMVNSGMANVKVKEDATIGWIGSNSEQNTLLTVEGGKVWSGNLGATGDLVTVKDGGFVNMDFGAGDDMLDLQNGSAETIDMGEGNDNATLHLGSVKNLSTGAGNDVVIVEKWGDTCKVENLDLGEGSNIVNVAWGEIDNITGGTGSDMINLSGGSVGIGEGTAIEQINVGQLYNTININGGSVAVINAVEQDAEKKNTNTIVMNGGSVGVANGFLKELNVNGGESNTITLGAASNEVPVIINTLNVNGGNAAIAITELSNVKDLRVNNAESQVTLDVTDGAVNVDYGSVASLTMHGTGDAVTIKNATVESLVVAEEAKGSQLHMEAGNVTITSGSMGTINMNSWGENVFEHTVKVNADASVGRIQCNWGGGDTKGQVVADVTLEGALNSAAFGGGADKLNIVGGTATYVDMGKGDDELSIIASSSSSAGTFYMGEGDDKVKLNAYGYIEGIHLDAGNDTFEMELTQSPWWTQVANLSTGAGDDTVTINSGTVTSLQLNAGSNTLNVNGGNVESLSSWNGTTNTVNVDGGEIKDYSVSGNDTISIFDGKITELKTQNGTTNTINVTGGEIKSFSSKGTDTVNMNGGTLNIVNSGKAVSAINITGGANTLVLDKAMASNITAAEGVVASVELTLKGNGDNPLVSGDIVLGSGDDVLNLLGDGGERLVEGAINTGAGNDTIIVDDTGVATIDMGEGNNNFRIDSGSVSMLTMGDGDNTVKGGSGLSNIVAGDGNNTINLLPNEYGGFTNSVKLGNGDNIINVSDGYGVASIETGNGNNIITVVRDESQRNTVMLQSLKTGSGNDTVTYNSIGYMQTIDVGAGDDTVIVDSPIFENGSGLTINLGEGNDSMSLLSDGRYTVNGGAGSDAYAIDWSKNFDISIKEVKQSGDINTLELQNASKYVAIMRNSSDWYSLMSNGNKQYLSFDGADALSTITAAGTTYSLADIEATFAYVGSSQIYFADVDNYLASQSDLDPDETERVPLFMVAGSK